MSRKTKGGEATLHPFLLSADRISTCPPSNEILFAFLRQIISFPFETMRLGVFIGLTSPPVGGIVPITILTGSGGIAPRTQKRVESARQPSAATTQTR